MLSLYNLVHLYYRSVDFCLLLSKMESFQESMKKRTTQDPSSLYTPKNRGGKNGGDGYNFQDSFMTPRILEWLATPGFHSYLKEGVDDVSVHFYSKKHHTWLYQMKKYSLDKGELKEILKHFTEKLSHPELNAERFFIGCCGLDKEIKSLWQMVLEYRRSKSAMTEEQLNSTRVELCKKIAELELSDYQDLLLSPLHIEYGHQGMQENDIPALKDIFLSAFVRSKFYKGENHEIIDKVFTSLALIVNKKIRIGVTKTELESLIRTELVNAKKGPATVVYLHGWIKQDYSDPANLVIDWTRHFDHSTLRIPGQEIWQKELLSELCAIRQNFDADGRKRNIWLRSKACLSAGLAFGNAFPEALGYNIQIEQLSPGSEKAIQYWQTDTPDQEPVDLNSIVLQADQHAKDIVVAIGITDDPKPKVEEFLQNTGLNFRAALYIYPQAGPSDISINERTAVGFARATKKEIRQACSQFSPKLIHLFFFGPLGLAVLLGQKLNGLVDIQCYERSKEHAYVPSCLVRA